MRKKHPKTREERRTINKTKTEQQSSVKFLTTTISYSNLTDQVVAFMDYIGVLPENAEVSSVLLGDLREDQQIPVVIKYIVRG